MDAVAKAVWIERKATTAADWRNAAQAWKEAGQMDKYDECMAKADDIALKDVEFGK